MLEKTQNDALTVFVSGDVKEVTFSQIKPLIFLCCFALCSGVKGCHSAL